MALRTKHYDGQRKSWASSLDNMNESGYGSGPKRLLAI